MSYLYVAASPEVSIEERRMVAGHLAKEFGGPIREMELPGLEFAFHPGRQQYGSIPVLELLLRVCPPDAWKVLGVTARDLFVPVLTFVYGQAQLGGQVGVISLARLRQEYYGLPPNPEVFVERARKEALHETGHLCGLVHCADRKCAMSLATNIRQIDGKDAAYCATCSGRLRRRPRE
jgi:archaemetzincin